MFALIASLAILPCAAETVHFSAPTAPPTPFQLRMARERGLPVPGPVPGQPLVGEFYRPPGNRPFPAVV